MVNLFWSKQFWLIIFIVLILGVLLQQLIKIDLAQKAYQQKVEDSKPVIEIKINQK